MSLSERKQRKILRIIKPILWCYFFLAKMELRKEGNSMRWREEIDKAQMWKIVQEVTTNLPEK